MYHIPIATHNRIARGEVPILCMKITTHLGDRVYTKKAKLVSWPHNNKSVGFYDMAMQITEVVKST